MANLCEPLVSVIIPTYNRSRIVLRAIESVLHQTFTDYEIIVVDDASSDDTEEVITGRYGDKIIFIKKAENKGLATARNTGIQASRGVYIAHLDDDDEWLPEKLAAQVKLIRQNPSLGLVYCGYFKVKEDGTTESQVKPEKRGHIFEELLKQNYIVGSASAALIKKEVLHKAGLFDESLSACEDWDLWIRIARHYQVDFVKSPLVRYRVHEHNMHKDIYRMEESTFRVLDKYWPEVCQEIKIEKEMYKIYSDHCISFAWQYYQAGDRSDFDRLVFRALECDPLNTIWVSGNDLRIKEAALFEAFDTFRNKSVSNRFTRNRKKIYTRQYVQIAWEYYHNHDMQNFRRCITNAFQWSFPRIPIRLIIPYVKSLLGKDFSDKVHMARKDLFNK